MKMEPIVLFDGECHFCNRAIQFIIKRDQKAYFKFASLQSEVGRRLQQKHNISPDENSFIFIDQDKYYSKSTAALHICRNLDGFWKALYPLLIVPRPIRNALYNIIANHRYKWFGKKETCEIPPPHIRERFL